MTDAHFHRHGYDTLLVVDDREFRFLGIHPWQVDVGEERRVQSEEFVENLDALRGQVAADVHAGVGEVGLDRLKTKVVPEAQRIAFEAQLKIAAEFRRPVVLHGAKCWGEVVKACLPHREHIPALLFHGFSRSTGLLPDIFSLNGFVSLGPALLNDHAVNYREMAKELPVDRLMIETDQEWDADGDGAPSLPMVDPAQPVGSRVPRDRQEQSAQLAAIAAKLAELRGVSVDAVQAACADNVRRFVETLA